MNTTELDLLLQCARSAPDPKRVKELAAAGIDWDVLLHLAQWHDVQPLLLRSLKSASWHSVPLSTRLKLEAFCKNNSINNLFLTAELVRLIGAFVRKGISVVTFKGPVLAHDLYGDVALRQFCDLDLMVRKSDISSAELLLKDCGYEAYYSDQRYRAAFLSYHGQYTFRSRTGVCVDLHWRLASKGAVCPLDEAEVWSRIRSVSMMTRPLPTFAPDDLALYLATHGTKEGWRSLKWICDYAELVRTNEKIDWEAVLTRAQRARATRPLLLAVVLASELLDAPVTPALLEEAYRSSVVLAIARDVKLRMARTTPAGELEEFVRGLETHDLLKHRLRAVATLSTTRTVADHEALPLPEGLWALYYLTRPFRLMGKGVHVLLGRSRPA